jgi:hypothetical protein
MKIQIKIALSGLLAISICSVAFAGFIRFKKPTGGGGQPSTPTVSPNTPTVSDPSLANTIWTGDFTVSFDKVYFTKDSSQRSSLISPKVNLRCELWFRTATTFTAVIDTRSFDYDSKHRRYEPLLGDQLGLNYQSGPLAGYRNSGTLNPANHTFYGTEDWESPAWDPSDIPDCKFSVSGGYKFTGTTSAPTLVATVSIVEFPGNADGIVFKGGVASGSFNRDSSRTVSAEIAAKRFNDGP